MTDPSISLAVRTPPPIDPMQEYGKALAIKGAIQAQQGEAQRQQIGQQQLQSGALTLQQQQNQVDQTKALNGIYRDSLTTKPDGTADIDTGRLTKALAQGGHGSAIPSVLENVTKFQKSAADLKKTNAEVTEKQADLGGAFGATIQAANGDPHLFSTLAQHAVESGSINKDMGGQYIQHIQQLLDQDPTGTTARQSALAIADQLVKGSPAQQKLANERTTANARQATAQTQQTRLTAELPRIQLQGQIAQQVQDAGSLAAAMRQGVPLADAIEQLPPERRTPFAKLKPSSTPEDILAIGTTPEQQLVSSATATARQNAEADRKITQGQRDQELQMMRDRLAKENATEHSSLISSLADRAVTESDAKGGQGIPDALKNVQNTKFYVGDPIGDYRGEVAKALQIRSGILPSPHPKVPSAVDALVQHLVGDDAPAPAANGKPALKPTPQTGGITVKAGDGSLHQFPTEERARAFETLVKKAGGTSSRVQAPAEEPPQR